MFELAGCTLEDLSAEVRRLGVEGALERLRVAGVRLSRKPGVVHAGLYA